MKPALSKFTEKNFEAINTLYGPLQPVFREFLWRIAMSGIYIRVTSAARSNAEQDALFLKGRPWLSGGTYGRKVTWVMGGYSFHNWNLAIDIAPLTRVGPIYYETLFTKKIFRELGIIAAELGISQPYAGDAGHFHYDQGLTNGVLDLIEAGGPHILIKPLFIKSDKPEVIRRAEGRLVNRGIIPRTNA